MRSHFSAEFNMLLFDLVCIVGVLIILLSLLLAHVSGNKKEVTVEPLAIPTSPLESYSSDHFKDGRCMNVGKWL